jgi:hypothetical protein
MAYLATATAWINQWGPIAWGVTGIGTALIVWISLGITSAIASYFRSRRVACLARARLDDAMSRTPDRINILERQFNRLTILQASLYVPYSPVLEAKQFSDCDFIGPGVLVFYDRCEVLGCHFLSCNHIIIGHHQGSPTGTTIFRSSRFERCRFVNITFLMPPEAIDMLRRQQGGDLVKFLGFEPPNVQMEAMSP